MKVNLIVGIDDRRDVDAQTERVWETIEQICDCHDQADQPCKIEWASSETDNNWHRSWEYTSAADVAEVTTLIKSVLKDVQQGTMSYKYVSERAETNLTEALEKLKFLTNWLPDLTEPE